MLNLFSDSYVQARERFLNAAVKSQASLQEHTLTADDQLTVDVATIGGDAPLSYFGSAVQFALMQQLQKDGLPENVRIVLLHALNPYGFAHQRRFDQNNVDLNRNFLQAAEVFQGSPCGYQRLNHFLNPQSPPSRLEPYKLKALWNISRYGIKALKAAIVAGQYDYPTGIFFGGKEPTESVRLAEENCEQWIGASKQIAHIDLHTGLGSFANYKLLINESRDSNLYPWYENTFGSDFVEPLEESSQTAYKITGSMGSWLQHRFADRNYYFIGAEFGTYDPVRVLGAIRAENRAYHYSDVSKPQYRGAKAEFLSAK